MKGIREYRSRIMVGDFYKGYIGMMNGILGLSEKEMEVLAGIMSYWAVDMDWGKAFGKDGRKAIRESVGLSDAGFNNYVMALKKKGVIVGDSHDELKVVDNLCAEFYRGDDNKIKSEVHFIFEIGI